jgi:hypothetical protein
MLRVGLVTVAGGTPGAGGGEPAKAVAIDPTVVAGVAAKLPDALKDKITFEVVEGDKGRHVAVQPKGWEAGVIPGRVKPPMGGADLGFMTAFATGSNCDGSCEAKDWKTVVESVEFAQFLGGGWDVRKDEALPDGRLLVIAKQDRVDVALARWKDGGSRYFYCRATLEKPITEAAEAFEEACRQMKVVDF